MSIQSLYFPATTPPPSPLLLLLLLLLASAADQCVTLSWMLQMRALTTWTLKTAMFGPSMNWA